MLRLASAVVLAAGLALPAGTAALGSRSSRPVYQPPQRYYLALGDSIAYGFQPTKRPGLRPSAFTGYVDIFAARLRKLSPGIQIVDYACPGESTVTFARGGCPGLADGFKLHDPFRGPQLDAARSFLRAHPGQVGPITLTLWGNDWFSLLLDRCKNHVACVRRLGPGAIAAYGSRLTAILGQLRAAAPAAEIIVTGAWNPDPERLEQLGPIYRSLEASIARAASASGARVAQVLPVFNPPGNGRIGKAPLCAFTFICSQNDPHPSDAGYRALAASFAAASGYTRRAA